MTNETDEGRHNQRSGAGARPPRPAGAGLQAVLIAGPTASGKSALAVAVARRIGGVVVNADSMQVYRELRVLTARPTEAEEASVPHRLYGHVPAAESYTVARWLADTARTLDEIAVAGMPAVIVGGTGLYFTALTEGLSDVPAIPDEIRRYWRGRAAETGAAALHAELAHRDAEMAARLRPSDAQRVVRALEVLDATGRSLAAWQGDRSPPVVARDRAVAAVIAPERAWLHGRIEARFRQMAETGGLEEAAALAALGLDPALPAMKAIGVPEMMAAAAGRLSVEAAIDAAVTATRRYAKRQETWFRNQMPDWVRITPDQPDAVDVLSRDSA